MTLKNETLQKLLKLAEGRIVGVLLTEGLITLEEPDKYYFSNINITREGAESIGDTKIQFTNEWIANYRDNFPQAKKSYPKSVKQKLEIFAMENDYTLEEITRGIDYYFKEHLEDLTYCMKACNFVYKYDPRKKVHSTLEEMIELSKDYTPKNTSEELLNR